MRFSESLNIFRGRKEIFKKNAKPKHNPIAIFRLRQIPTSYLAPPCARAIAQTVNRTKMFHVKLFGTIGQKSPDEPTAMLWVLEDVFWPPETMPAASRGQNDMLFKSLCYP